MRKRRFSGQRTLGNNMLLLSFFSARRKLNTPTTDLSVCHIKVLSFRVLFCCWKFTGARLRTILEFPAWSWHINSLRLLQLQFFSWQLAIESSNKFRPNDLKMSKLLWIANQENQRPKQEMTPSLPNRHDDRLKLFSSFWRFVLLRFLAEVKFELNVLTAIETSIINHRCFDKFNLFLRFVFHPTRDNITIQVAQHPMTVFMIPGIIHVWDHRVFDSHALNLYDEITVDLGDHRFIASSLVWNFLW